MPRLREVALEGQHVRLEPLRMQHAAELWPAADEPGLFQHLAPGTEGGLKELETWIARRIEEQEHDEGQAFLMRDANTGQAFGCTGYKNVSIRHKRVEIGNTWVGKTHRRTPANTEAKLLMLQHAFEDWKAVRVQFKVDVRNEAGNRAMERIGATLEGTMRNERILIDGFVRDAYVYAIIDREWPQVKSQLHGLLYIR